MTAKEASQISDWSALNEHIRERIRLATLNGKYNVHVLKKDVSKPDNAILSRLGYGTTVPNDKPNFIKISW